MNQTNEIEFVPTHNDGLIKTKPMAGTVDKASQPGGPMIGIAKKVTPKKHPPKAASSGAAASVDKKISKISFPGQNVHRNTGHERLEKTNSKESDIVTNKRPKKHSPSRETSLVRELRRVKRTILDSGTNGSTIPKKHPPREYSLDPVDRKKENISEGSDYDASRRHCQEPGINRTCLKDTDQKMSKPCTRQSVDRKLLRRNSNDKIRARSTERKHSAPPGTTRGRARSTERTKSIERKPSKELTQGKTRARSIERKRQKSKDKTRSKAVEQTLNKEWSQPRFAERKDLTVVPINHRPKSEELVPYTAPTRFPIKDRRRSKSADRVTGRESIGHARPSKVKAAPLCLKSNEAPPLQPLKKGIYNAKADEGLRIENVKPRGPDIIELSKQSTSSKEDTITTTDDDASCCNNSTSCTDGSSEDVGAFLTRHVSFGNVEVQEFAYSLGCNVVSRDGPPVSIAQNPLRSKRFDVDTFEKDRSLSRRHRDDLLLSEIDRIIILQRCGYTAEEIEQACWDAENVRKQRLKSIKNKDWDGWNAASESLARKIAKISSAKDLLFGSS